MQTFDNWSLNKLELITQHHKIENFNNEQLLKKGTSRKGFVKTNSSVTIPVYFVTNEGMSSNEDELYDQLFLLDKKLSTTKLYLKFESKLDSAIATGVISDINSAWKIVDTKRALSKDDLYAVIDNISLLKGKRHPDFYKTVKAGIIKLVDHYCATSATIQSFKNVLIHIIHWCFKYLLEILNSYDYSENVPAVVYYGDITKREIYFLLFCNIIGMDVIYFNSKRASHFDIIDPSKKYINRVDYPLEAALRPFPTKLICTSVETEAFAASEEVGRLLHSDNSMFYKPWQLKDYQLQALKLITTYEEINILVNEPAMMRNGWDVSHNMISLPNFFTKVNGVHPDINRYYNEINAFRKLENTIVVDQLPISKINKELPKVEYYSVCGSDNYTIDEEKLLTSAIWPYKHLQLYVQKAFANAIKTICSSPKVIRQRKYAKEEQKIIIFKVLMNIENRFLEMIQKFDYPKQIPKCVVYNNEINGELIFEDSILIYFLSTLGLDVFIFNPAGQNDIEIYIDRKEYNSHHLEKKEFNLPLKSFSLFGKYI